MTPSTVLAIDQGTSGTKALVVHPDDGVVAVAEEPVCPAYLPGGGVEQDPEELLASVLGAGHRAVAAGGRSIDVVSLANQGETVLAWDPTTGRPLSPAIVWQDRRAEGLTKALSGAADWVVERTGLVLDPYFSAPKMAWLRRHVTAEGVVTTTDSWLIHRLCGEFVTDVSTASRSLLTGLDTTDWDADLLALFGWENEPLPRIVDCDAVVGSTRVFGAEMAVAGLIVDQQAALLAQSCTEAGTAKCTFGTGAFLLANTGPDAVRSAAGLTSSVAWRIRGELSYCLDGQVYTAASAVRWMIGLGLITTAQDMDRLAADDAGGVLCVPALAGLAAPWWRADATAAFVGMSLSTGPEHLIVAVLQGIAAQIAELTALVDSDLGAPVRRLRVDGGLTRSTTLMQAAANLLQRPIDVYPSAHATAIGAAALGRLAGTPGLAVPEAVASWTAVHTYEPQWSAQHAADFLGRWRHAVAAALPPQSGEPG